MRRLYLQCFEYPNKVVSCNLNGISLHRKIVAIMCFYGVALPCYPDGASGDFTKTLVFQDKDEVLRFLKTNKGGRFKAFSTREEAETFVLDSMKDQIKNSNESGIKDKVASNEGCNFPSLTPQELKQLKNAIQEKDVNLVQELVASSPRFLITTSDNPAILHSGTRSNALHFAAKSESLQMVETILDMVQDPKLLEQMYPTESAESRARRLEYLLDQYLNMPNKGHNDTPLHIASKAGSLDLVRYLVNFSSCNTDMVNCAGKTPAEVACERVVGEVDLDIKKEIEAVLIGQVYIPVIRDTEMVNPSYLGEPWSPRAHDFGIAANQGHNRPVLFSPMPKRTIALSYSPSSPIVAHSPLQLTGKRSPLLVGALLGPLSPQDAEKVKVEWKAGLPRDVKLKDPVKGIEKHGRVVAKKHEANMLEYWDFLKAYCDFSTSEGLQLLENHLYNVRRDHEKAREEERQKEIDELDINYLTPKKTLGRDGASPMTQITRQLEHLHVTSPSPLVKENASTQDKSPILSAQISSDDSFCSVDTDVSSLSFQTADEGPWIYILGSQPSSMDRDVFEIVSKVEFEVSKYPELWQWVQIISLAPEEEIKSWKNHFKPQRKLEVPKLVFE